MNQNILRSNAHTASQLNSAPVSEDRLRQLCNDLGLSKEPRGQALITEMLSFAAQAEQRIAEQDARIHRLESLSMTDELTGLLNRRGFSFGLKRALQSARRYGEEGILAFIDLDNFKPINDTYGHEAGDQILRRTGEILTGNVRKTDLVSRLGGDEFAVLLVHSQRRDGLSRIAILDEKLNRTSYKYGDVRIPIRASFGAAHYSGWSEPEPLMRKADRAMYKNKLSRRRNLHLISQTVG